MSSEQRLALLPPIRRAREFYLYDYRGRRYLDFWQNGGRAILGHRPNRLNTRLKNALSSGLLAELPSVYGARLARVVRQLLEARHPDTRHGEREYHVRWYQGPERANAAIAAVLGGAPGAAHDPVHDLVPDSAPQAPHGPAPGSAPGSPHHAHDAHDARVGGGARDDDVHNVRGGGAAGRDGTPERTVSLWRPFLGSPHASEASHASHDAAGAAAGAGRRYHETPLVLLPVLPFPGAFAPQIVCFSSSPEPPASDLVSPWLLAGLERAALALQQDSRLDGAAAWPQARPVQRRGRGRAPHWEEFASSLWRRVGPYLVWIGEGSVPYDDAFRRFLEAGFVLSPERDAPSIIPGRCSHGEFARFVAVCREIEEGARC